MGDIDWMLAGTVFAIGIVCYVMGFWHGGNQ